MKYLYVLAFLFMGKSLRNLVNSSECLNDENLINNTVEVGLSTTILCHVSQNESKEIYSSQVVWKWRESNVSNNWILIDENDIVAIEEEGSTNDQSVVSELHLKNVSLIDTGFYGCFVDDARLLDEEQLSVGYSPEVPSNLNCITNGDITYMECCWHVNPTYCETGYTLYDCIQDGTNESMCCEYDSTTERACCDIFVERNYFLLHTLTLNVQNQLGDSVSNSTDINPSKHVKPYPPNNVTSKPWVRDERDCCLDIGWLPPYNQRLCYEYFVECGEELSEDWLYNKTVIGILSVNFCNLKSTTSYKTRVKAKPSSDGCGSSLYDGEWSDWSEISIATTNLTIPSSDFTFNDVILLIPAPGVEEISTYFSWYAYLYQEEEEFRYYITYGNCLKETQTNITDQIDLTIFLEAEMVCLSGAFCNKAGCSATNFYNATTTQALPAPFDVNANMNENLMNITWDLLEVVPIESSCQIRLCTTLRGAGVSNVGDHELGDDYCTYSAFSKELTHGVDCWDRNTSIYLSSPCSEYYAIVEIVSKDFIVQSGESQIVSFDPVIESPSYFTAEDDSTLTEFSIFLEWSQITDCQGMSIAVEYSPADESQNALIQEFPNCDDTSGSISNEIYGDIIYILTMKMMCPGDSYNIVKRDELNSPLLFDMEDTTTQATTSIGEPMPPTDVKISEKFVLNPLLQWEAPEHSNGRNTKYAVQYGYNENMKSEDTATTEIEVYIPCQNEENTTFYSFDVRAYNLLENGTSVYSESANLSNVSCVLVEGLLVIQIAMIVVFGVLGIILIILLFLNRQKVKRKLIKPNFVPQIKIGISDENKNSNDNISYENDEDDILEPIDIVEMITENRYEVKDKLELKDRIDSGIDNETFDKEETMKELNHQNSGESSVFGQTNDVCRKCMDERAADDYKITLWKDMMQRKTKPILASTLSLDSGFTNRSRTSSSTYKAYVKYVHVQDTLHSSSYNSFTSGCDTWSNPYKSPYNITSLDLASDLKPDDSAGIQFNVADSEDNESDYVLSTATGFVHNEDLPVVHFNMESNKITNAKSDEKMFQEDHFETKINSFLHSIPIQHSPNQFEQTQEINVVLHNVDIEPSNITIEKSDENINQEYIKSNLTLHQNIDTKAINITRAKSNEHEMCQEDNFKSKMNSFLHSIPLQHSPKSADQFEQKQSFAVTYDINETNEDNTSETDSYIETSPYVLSVDQRSDNNASYV